MPLVRHLRTLHALQPKNHLNKSQDWGMYTNWQLSTMVKMDG